MPSRFHHTAKILLTASPVWTLMATAMDRAAVGHVVASTHGRLAFGGFFAFGADAGQEFRGGFVGPAFLACEFGFGGHKLTAEGFGEKRWGELVHVCLRLRQPSLDLVGQRKERFRPASLRACLTRANRESSYTDSH